MRFFTADTHFSSEQEAYDRGFITAYEMNKYLVDKWNSTVGSDDEVLDLGGFGYLDEDLLNGNIEHVMDDCIAAGIDGEFILAGYFPYGEDMVSHRPVDNGLILLHGHTLDKVSTSIRGSLQICVGVDVWDFAPVSEELVAGMFWLNPR